jgi:hypothetical protein
LSAPPNDFEQRLARDFGQKSQFSAVPFAQQRPSHIEARGIHTIYVWDRPLGIADVRVVTAFRQFIESQRLLCAALDVMGRVRTATHNGTAEEVTGALTELFMAGRHISKHLADTETAMNIAELEAANEARGTTEAH